MNKPKLQMKIIKILNNKLKAGNILFILNKINDFSYHILLNIIIVNYKVLSLNWHLSHKSINCQKKLLKGLIFSKECKITMNSIKKNKKCKI